ncbi:MAG TPA: hypothetical protein VNK43_01740 [Gemmatimonadales bacterium]|nr:hypothetical protein [Gemmatimonadales bacterium]
MQPKPTSSLVAELETTLGLLNDLMVELQTQRHWDPGSRVDQILTALHRRPALAELPRILLRVYNEISAALTGIRLTREAIQAQAIERLRDGHVRLSEVSSTTESATLEIIAALDRTVALLDQLQAGGGAEAQTAVAALRGEIDGVFNHLQFQDITSQQLRGVADLLQDVERRIATVADLFDQTFGLRDAAVPGPVGEPADRAERAYNPDATTRDVAARQALADAAFGMGRGAAATASGA